MSGTKKQRTCFKGHQFYKSSDCPVCPECEKENMPKEGFWMELPAPARRALNNAGINEIKDLCKYTKSELMALHGFGKSSIPIIEKALHNKGLFFKGI